MPIGDGGGGCNLLPEMVTETKREAAWGCLGGGGMKESMIPLFTSAGRMETRTSSEEAGGNWDGVEGMGVGPPGKDGQAERGSQWKVGTTRLACCQPSCIVGPKFLTGTPKTSDSQLSHEDI